MDRLGRRARILRLSQAGVNAAFLITSEVPIPGCYQAESEPEQDNQRQSGLYEITELILSRPHHQKVGLIAHGRGEGAITGKETRNGEHPRVDSDIGSEPNPDRCKQYGAGIVTEQVCK